MSRHTDLLKQQLRDTEARIGRRDSYNQHAAKQAEILRRRLADSERLDRAQAEAEKAREQRQREADREERAGLESRLMAEYRAQIPGADAADARHALPRLLEEHRLKVKAEAEADHRRTVARYGQNF